MFPGNNTSAALEHQIATWAAGTAADDIPPEVFVTSERFSLDVVGVIAGAARAPGIHELNATMRSLEVRGGNATSLVSGARLSPASAALVNGVAAHALDFDDQHDSGRVHTFCVVFASALAAAEAEGGVSGKEFLASIALGAELFCRLGLTCVNSLGKGWHPTTTLGTLAAAVTAGRILGLDVDGTTNALGLAFGQLGGTTQSIADGTLGKRLGPGFAARSGVLAAYLARGGLTGPYRFLDGQAGLFKVHERDEVRREELIKDLGSSWRLVELSMKPFPCCRCSHTVIELGFAFRAAGLKKDDVASVTIELGAVNQSIVGAPYRPFETSSPVVHAQFNAAYAFVRAFQDGVVDLASFAPEAVASPDVDLTRNVSCVVAPDIEASAIAPARVRLLMRDGSIHERFSSLMKGSPAAPMTDAEVLAKFRSCLAFGLQIDPSIANRFAERILTLRGAPDVGFLVDHFRRALA